MKHKTIVKISLIFLLLLVLSFGCKKESKKESEKDPEEIEKIRIPEAYPGVQGDIQKFVINGDTITCNKINGQYIFQGDIILTKEQLLNSDTTKGAGKPTSKFGLLWPFGMVYYKIDESALAFTNDILEAIKEFEEYTSIRFMKRTDEVSYITFIHDASGCSSNFGMQLGPQEIKLEWSTKGTVIHEICHALGIIHEFDRSDRDDYIKILTDNIIDDKEFNFKILNCKYKTPSFDFNSIMMYPSKTIDEKFAIDITKPIITKIDGSGYYCNSTDLSDGDILLINLMYSGNWSVSAPLVFTKGASEIKTDQATVGGKINFSGNAAITERGIIWRKYSDPESQNRRILLGEGLGSFSTTITGLSPGTYYSFQAFATNSEGTGYGIQLSFLTNKIANLPIVITYPIESQTFYSFIGRGNITSDGGSAITSRGICWSTSANPTTALTTITSEGSGTGVFMSTITGLTANTTYYVRAYAINSVGTAYGDELTFTTSQTSSQPTVITNPATEVSNTTTTLNGSVNANSQTTTVSFEYGISTSYGQIIIAIPNNLTGSSNTDVKASLTGLSENTTYHFRVSATNSLGTTNGNDMSFTTSSSASTGTVTDIEGNVYKTVIIGSQTWMAENLKATKFNDGTALPNVSTDGNGWLSLTTPSYCWYNNDATTYKVTYGALYNWFVVDEISNGGKNVCPTGWHVPQEIEWTTLTDYLVNNHYGFGGSGDNICKSLASTEGWAFDPTPGDIGNDQLSNNSSGFNATPSGAFLVQYQEFSYIGEGALWWSSTQASRSNYAIERDISAGSNVVSLSESLKQHGMSVRCIKD